MKKLLRIIAFLLLCAPATRAQEPPAIISRVIFIGDAGEIDTEQSQLIAHAAGQVLAGKTNVMYLGDNIYPSGMGLPGSPEAQKTREILSSQFKPMRENGASVFFIPGNHDWDRSGPAGLEKIRVQSKFLEAQNDPQLKMIPANGCPDPVLVPIAPGMSIIAFDSEWWLSTHAENNADGNCQCSSKDDVIKKMKHLAAKHKNQILILASHHPFKSYGVHGGYFSLLQHIFPLRDLHKSLYVPLPVLGSLYPIIRGSFPNVQDIRHKKYQEMIKRIDAAFAEVPNIIHVAGHDHGLQFIKEKHNIQVVSGAGTKTSNVVKGKNALYGNAVQGYVVADLLPDKSIKFKFYEEQANGIVQSFSFVKQYVMLND